MKQVRSRKQKNELRSFAADDDIRLYVVRPADCRLPALPAEIETPRTLARNPTYMLRSMYMPHISQNDPEEAADNSFHIANQ